jgi:hypothetical protein
LDCGIDCAEDHGDDGIIQKYVHLTRKFEAPASYHVFALIAAVASATGRRVAINRKGYKLWPNLYVLLHGPSGLGKGIASNHAIDLVKGVLGDQLKEYPEDLTGEGLFRLMNEQTKNGEPCVGLVYSDEFSELLGGQDYKQEFAKRLTRLYSCPDKMGTGRSKSGVAWAENVFLNILGNSQEDWLRTLPAHAVKGGLFARILTIPESKKRHWMFEPEVDVELGREIGTELAERLAEIGDGGTVELSDAARKMGLDWYENDEAAKWKLMHPVVQPWCERRLDHAIKLGYINSLLEGQSGPLIVDQDGLTWGLEAVEWLTPRIQEAFLKMDESKYGELHRMMMTMILKAGGEMRDQSLRAGLGNKYSASQLDEGIRHLIVIGAVTRQEKSNERGRTEWRICAIDPTGMEALVVGDAAKSGSS